MEFRIADAFIDSLSKLTNEGQKAVKTTVFDLEEVYNTERHLLYVASTRACDHLLVTAVEPTSEFLEDIEV